MRHIISKLGIRDRELGKRRRWGKGEGAAIRAKKKKKNAKATQIVSIMLFKIIWKKSGFITLGVVTFDVTLNA